MPGNNINIRTGLVFVYTGKIYQQK
jgi:hypothetical protein